jgi:O-methyltransferase
MTSKFGFLSKLNFLQDLASNLIAGVNPAIVHNIEKYYVLKKVHYLSAIEQIEGDYLEFGVFTGSSFCHSIRCCKKLAKLYPNLIQTKFYGFDSFAGFGTLEEGDEHPFYTDDNFATSLAIVKKRVQAVKGKFNFELIPGFFSDVLKSGAEAFKIEKSRVIFIDSDTYSSARDALQFCLTTLQQGTFIVLDDYYSYRGSEQKGVRRAFSELITQNNIKVRHVFSYGMGGVVYVVSDDKV